MGTSACLSPNSSAIQYSQQTLEHSGGPIRAAAGRVKLLVESVRAASPDTPGQELDGQASQNPRSLE